MKTPCIQLIINNEDYLAWRQLHHIKSQLLDDSMRDFNFETVSARDVSGQELADIFNTLPMMAAFRLVIVTDVEQFKKNDLEVLAAYFQSPSPTTHCVLMGTKIDKRTGFFKAIKKTGEVIECKALYVNQVPQFVEQEARTMGLQLERGCAERIAEVVGTNLMSLVSELEKISLYVWPEKIVTREHVKASVSSGLVENVFLISELIAKQGYYPALTLYRKMSEQGEPAIKILALVIGHFRKLLLLMSAQKNRVAQNEYSSLLGVNPYFIKNYLTQVRLFNETGLKKIYEKLMEASYQLRSLSVSDDTVFETFLQSVCVKA